MRLVCDDNLNKGVLNAVEIGVHDTFEGTALYLAARARRAGADTGRDGSYTTVTGVSPDASVTLPMVGVLPPAGLLFADSSSRPLTAELQSQIR